MFIVDRTESGVIVRGPEGFEKLVPGDAICVVHRNSVEDSTDESLRPFTIMVSEMTNSEIVAFVLGIEPYPSN